MICKNCGKELPEGSTVCFECGVAQNEVTPVTTPTKQTSGSIEVKSKATAAILALLLGGWGAHDFYLGFTKMGIIKIALTIVSYGLIGGIWGFIDFIRIVSGSLKTDAKGNPIF